MAGVALVIKSIRDRRLHFGRPSMVERLSSRLGRLPALLGKPNPITGTARVSIGALLAESSGQVRVSPSPSASLDERVAALEENLRRIDDRISTIDNQLRSEGRELSNELAVSAGTA
jgi:hypothetical protein